MPKPQNGSALSHPLPAGMRDLLPEEARRHLALGRALLGSFERFGYEPVSLPPFEYAEVLEHDVGPLDASQLLRFVEPESGEVVALRSDMTPQVARLVAARLADAPLPARLCYEGAVVRRRVERARRDRQIYQAGFELVGQAGPDGDLEVLTVAASAVRAAGLQSFTLDLGHAGIAGALLASVDPAAQGGIVEALAKKDSDETARRAERAGVSGRALTALAELPHLCGGADVWARADRVLGGTAAVGPASELRALFDRGSELGLSTNLVVDLGDTRSFAYYTGMLFHVLAEGPGEAVGAGGRYDHLFDRFRCPRPAAGFAIDVGNLAWALDRSGKGPSPALRVLVTSAGGSPSGELLGELRREGVACAPGPESGAEAHARAWRYTHILALADARATLRTVSGGEVREFLGGDLVAALREAASFLKSIHAPRSKEEAT